MSDARNEHRCVSCKNPTVWWPKSWHIKFSRGNKEDDISARFNRRTKALFDFLVPSISQSVAKQFVLESFRLQDKLGQLKKCIQLMRENYRLFILGMCTRSEMRITDAVIESTAPCVPRINEERKGSFLGSTETWGWPQLLKTYIWYPLHTVL